MKKFKLVILLLMGIVMMFAVVGCGKEKRLTKLTMYYSNDVIPTRQFEFEYDKRGNMTKEILCHPDGNKYVYEEWEYDLKGNHIRHILYYENSWITVYELDAKGNPVKKISYIGDKEGDKNNCELKLERVYDNEYDSDGNLIAVYEIEDNKKQLIESHKYQYDDKGNIIVDKCTKDPHHIMYWVKYNKYENIIYDNDRYQGYNNVFEYDSKGRKIWKNKDGTSPVKYEYNDAGMLTKVIEYKRGKSGEELKLYRWYEYEYK